MLFALHQLTRLAAVTAAATLICPVAYGQEGGTTNDTYEYPETRALVALVDDAAALVHDEGEGAFAELRQSGSRWREGERYIFVLAPDGTMLVHPDPAMEGTNQLTLKDVAGKPIIRGLIDAATELGHTHGWYHYQWPVPGGLLPRWKSSYVRLVDTASGARFIVGAGVYNDRMERPFVVDMVKGAVAEIEEHGNAAFSAFRDPTGPFAAKDAYVFVVTPDGRELVNPAFPNLEGRELLDLQDTEGKALVREMLDVVNTSGSGWVDYMWPKPGESVSTVKSTYVSRARLGASWVMVGCGVYLADAPKARTTAQQMTAPALMALVRDGAAVLEQRGEAAYPEFRKEGSKWFHDGTYIFVWTLDGTRVFHAAAPSGEGADVTAMNDILGRPIGKMIMEAANSPSGEGWVHYMYPEPGSIFPTWKSTFVERVRFPSGEERIIGSGIYNMQMDQTFIQDVVDRAAALIESRGENAFGELRDKTGPFVFMNTYVFVDTPDGVELVNAAQPSMEGTRVSGLTDINGKRAVDEYIHLALSEGGGWTDYYWYKPGENTPAHKQTYVRRVQSAGKTYIVGSGFYPEDESPSTNH